MTLFLKPLGLILGGFLFCVEVYWLGILVIQRVFSLAKKVLLRYSHTHYSHLLLSIREVSHKRFLIIYATRLSFGTSAKLWNYRTHRRGKNNRV